MKKSFVFYTVWGAAVQNMTDAQAGALLKAVIAYQTDKTVRPDDASVGFVFDLIRQKLDEDAAAYAEVCAQRAESGRLGGMKRAENMKQMLASASNSKQMLASASKSKQTKAVPYGKSPTVPRRTFPSSAPKSSSTGISAKNKTVFLTRTTTAATQKKMMRCL